MIGLKNQGQFSRLRLRPPKGEFGSHERRNNLSQPLLNHHANHGIITGLMKEDDSLMIGRRRKRARSRAAKSKQRAQTSGKNYKVLRRSRSADNDEPTLVEPIHSLLLSSLRYWEVERDLIEERIASIPPVTAKRFS